MFVTCCAPNSVFYINKKEEKNRLFQREVQLSLCASGRHSGRVDVSIELSLIKALD